MTTLFTTNPIVIEAIGYLASALILISFLFKNIKTVRIVNLIGAFAFVFYGFFTKTYPTMFMNMALIIVQCVFLHEIIKKEKQQRK